MLDAFLLGQRPPHKDLSSRLPCPHFKEKDQSQKAGCFQKVYLGAVVVWEGSLWSAGIEQALRAMGLTSLLSLFPSMWLHAARRAACTGGQPEGLEASSLTKQGGKKGAAEFTIRNLRDSHLR